MALSEEDKAWIAERLEQVETRLLTAFHGWASPAEARMRGQGELVRALDLEIAAIKDRLDKLEAGRPAQ